MLGERVSSQQQSVEDTARSKGLIKLGANWQAPEVAPVKYTYTALKRMPAKTGEQDEMARRKERRQRQREETATSKCVHLEGVQAVLLEDTRHFTAEATALEALTPRDGEEGSARTDAGSRLQREIDELTEELAQEQRIALELREAARRRQEMLEDRVDELRARIRQARTEKQRAQLELEEQTDTMRTLDAKTTVLRSRLTSKVPWQSRQ
jgi:chromosome segregation ATPase